MTTARPDQRRSVWPFGLTFVLMTASLPVDAMTLAFPATATATATRAEALASMRLAIGPWAADTGLPTRLAQGALDQTAWRITAAEGDPQGLSTLAILTPLRTQLVQAGYRTIYECETAACGGFDFRYSIEVLPEPDMHIDLGDFRYLVAERSTPAGPDLVALMVSRSATAGFTQLTRIGPAVATAPEITAEPGLRPVQSTTPTDVGAQLETTGAIALDDLVFASAAANLLEGDYVSLQRLADYLKADSARQVVLVGHTDADGSLEANIALSRKRAAAVRQYLITAYAVPAAQIGAEGVGYLAPRASNLTEEGRTRNRRVEVMLTSTQ